MTKPRTAPQPTCVFKVEEALRKQDDFMSVGLLMAATGCSNNQVTAALRNLKNYHAAECVAELDGRTLVVLNTRHRHADPARRRTQARRQTAQAQGKEIRRSNVARTSWLNP